MGAELLESSPVFRRAIQACAAALAPHGIDLLAEFGRADGWSSPALAMAGLSALQARAGAWPRQARARCERPATRMRLHFQGGRCLVITLHPHTRRLPHG